MSTNLSGTEVLRFEIAVNASAYRTLVAGLREPASATSISRIPKRSVKTSIELDLASRSYSVNSLGRHRLPRSLSVKPGSKTHRNITSLIATSLREQEAHDLAVMIERIIEAAPTISGDFLQMFRGDLEFQPTASGGPSKRQVRTVEILGTIAPTLLLDIDDTPTLIVPERPEEIIENAVQNLKAEATLTSPLRAKVHGNSVELSGMVHIPAIPEVPVGIFIHWGSYDVVTTRPWQDELVSSSTRQATAEYSVAHTVQVPHQGYYGATLFLQVHGSHEPIWLGRFGEDDAHFHISSDDSVIADQRNSMLQEMQEIAHDILRLSVQHPHTLNEQVKTIQACASHLGLGALFKKACEANGGDNFTANLIETLREADEGASIDHLVHNYGIGEIVFATPEGPHAAAGGLAQVISGLPSELCKAGIPTTIITPLYSYENGNKHPSAQTLLSKGIKIGSETITPIYLGSITVNLGPTYQSGTTFHCRQPSALPIKVFLAQSGGLRIFLLANPSVFDRLYQPVYADEQLRRAIVLSRATLETIATSHFGIRPSAIISNDWMTACVPAFAALDPRYTDVEWLRECKTIHMIHNGGADYHGRLPINVNHEDLWPMLNLAPEHFFGFRDPHNYNLINFTMAASQHANGAVITVSQPYARQIANLGGGDGIDYVLQHKRRSVFGISNGINRAEIDRFLSSLTGLSNEELNDTDALLRAKATARANIQARYALAPRPGARLISFIGRVAEQKGLMLLSGFVENSGHSALEDLLLRHDDIQILVAGPTTNGDKTSDDFRHAVEYLRVKYPGRVAAHFDYIPHSRAVECMFASTFMMMPSRFEPGGITQLEALAAGTLVIGRNVGGISATIENFNKTAMSGNGFLCDDYSPTAFANTAHWALSTTRDSAAYKVLVSNARLAQHTWTDRVPAYQAMLQRVILGEQDFSALRWNDNHKAQLASLAVE